MDDENRQCLLRKMLRKSNVWGSANVQIPFEMNAPVIPRPGLVSKPSACIPETSYTCEKIELHKGLAAEVVAPCLTKMLQPCVFQQCFPSPDIASNSCGPAKRLFLKQTMKKWKAGKLSGDSARNMDVHQKKEPCVRKGWLGE